MRDHVHDSPNLIYSAGTQVVAREALCAPGGEQLHPAGAVGVVTSSPDDRSQAYRVRFTGGLETSLLHDQLVPLAAFKLGELNATSAADAWAAMNDRVIYRCVIGSRAYGLETAESDTDRRGVYLPRATDHWSLAGVPEQLENDATQEAYWELRKFLVMALKANPNILECLYSPLVETATPLARELLALRPKFLSRVVYQTYNGYVLSQFKKMQTDLRNQGAVKWKHVMHLIRLLLSGITVLREGVVQVHVGARREELLAIKRGQMPWAEVEAWRQSLHQEFAAAFATTSLPEKPDFEAADAFLIKARRLATAEELP